MISSRDKGVLCSFFPSLFLLILAGCRVSSPAAISPESPVLATIQGHVHGGEQPVVGASIQLYAAGTPTSGGGVGLGSQALITGILPVTDINGNFTITGRYTLPATASFLYIVATGGNSGATNLVNPHIALMAVLSNCTGSSASAPLSNTFTDIDEVTTVGAVMALQNYMAPPATGNAGAPAIGAAGTAAGFSGLQNGFEQANNLVSSVTGTSLKAANNWATSDNNSLTLNTLADILVYCVNSDPSVTTNCTTLFNDVTPTGTSFKPTDTIQAAWYMSQNPTDNIVALFAHVPSTPPFVGLTTAPSTFAMTTATATSACQAAVPLLSLTSFNILAATTVTNTGPTLITGGNLGLSPGTAVTGITNANFTSPAHLEVTTGPAAQGQLDASTVYGNIAGLTNGVAMPIDLSNLTLTPGLYLNATAETLNSGKLTLDALGDPNAVFIFQIGTTLTTIGSTQVVLAGGAQAKNVFWAVGTQATLGTYSAFQGNLLAFQAVTATTGASINGRMIALNAAVTMDTNAITAP